MERGFHGYRKLPSTASPGPEIGKSVADGNHTGSSSSSAAATAASSGGNHHSNADETGECTVREQDRFMPIANVIRIMRRILPPHAKISDDAKETIQECVSEYISFITGEANDRCLREQRKTITAEDVLWAMSKLGFDDYVEPLTIYLHRHREMEGDRVSLRGETFMKRAVAEYGNLGVPAAFARGFPMAGPAGPHPGYFGALPMGGGYFKDGNTSHEGPSNGANGNGEARGQFD